MNVCVLKIVVTSWLYVLIFSLLSYGTAQSNIFFVDSIFRHFVKKEMGLKMVYFCNVSKLSQVIFSVRLILIAGALFLLSSVSAQTVYYVDGSNIGVHQDGTSWEKAFTTIQEAVDLASGNGASEDNPGEVWVAMGQYTSQEEQVVELLDHVHLYGGFYGNESNRDERQINEFVTVLDGENTRRCVLIESLSVVDGFSIVNGSANYGGGIYINDSSPVVNHCIFSDNNAQRSGGAVYIDNSSPLLQNCSFYNNYVPGSKPGSEIGNSDSFLIVKNSFFFRTKGHEGRSCIYNTNDSTMKVLHCTLFYENVVQNKPILNDNGSLIEVSNSIMWSCEYPISGFATVNDSCSPFWMEGDRNIAQNPLFWSPSSADFRLHSSSPCLDAGVENELVETDFYGTSRPVGGGVDMGAVEMNDPDTDRDGLYDQFELQYSKTCPYTPDTDGNGLNDYQDWFNDPVVYVKADSMSNTPDGRSWETAFRDIQSGITAARDHGGGEVWIAQGRYTGTDDNVVVLEDNTHLYGGFYGFEVNRDQRRPDLFRTIVDGEMCRRILFINWTEDYSIDGIIFKNGLFERGSAIYSSESRGEISRCEFRDNSETSISGVFYIVSSDIDLDQTVFDSNSQPDGFGLFSFFSSTVQATNCLFSDNYHSGSFSACFDSSSSHVSFMNCTIVGNIPNNTHYSHLFDMSESDITIKNSIIWNNRSPIADGIDISYSFVEGGYPGEGNISSCPLFWNPLQGDFRLHVNSPCRNSGIYEGAPLYDIRGAARFLDNRIDMGAIEMNEVDSDHDGLYDDFESSVSMTDPGDDDSDEDGFNDGSEWFDFDQLYVKSTSEVVNSDGRTWGTAYQDLQKAVDESYVRGGSGRIYIAEGSYSVPEGCVVTMRDNTQLYGGYSGDEGNPSRRDCDLYQTIIDGANTTQCVKMTSLNNAALDGLYIQSGSASTGAGMFIIDSRVSIKNCQLSNNKSSGNGAGIYVKISEISMMDCNIHDNESEKYGGGMYIDRSSAEISRSRFISNKSIVGGAICIGGSDTQIYDCSFIANAASASGGALFHDSGSDGIYNQCLIKDNTAGGYGGGLHIRESSPRIINSVLDGNKAYSGAGIYNYSEYEYGILYNRYRLSNSDLINCTFVNNIARESGHGVLYRYYSYPQIKDSIQFPQILGSLKSSSSYPQVRNCIFNGLPNQISCLLYSYGDFNLPQVTNSCLPGGHEGEGNIDADPQFVDPENGDYSLLRSSPCLNTGIFINGAPQTDFRGVLRPQGDGIDMGAYETVYGGLVIFSQ